MIFLFRISREGIFLCENEGVSIENRKVLIEFRKVLIESRRPLIELREVLIESRKPLIELREPLIENKITKHRLKCYNPIKLKGGNNEINENRYAEKSNSQIAALFTGTNFSGERVI